VSDEISTGVAEMVAEDNGSLNSQHLGIWSSNDGMCSEASEIVGVMLALSMVKASELDFGGDGVGTVA